LGDMGIGGIMDPWIPAVGTTRMTNAVQKYLVTKTRLGIPALIMAECLHGHLSPGATIFPQAIGLSCSWDPGVVESIASAAAKEASSVGIRQAFSPDLDLGRDPRWGRVEETYGEDSYLCSRLGVAYVRGLQGGKGKLGPGKLAATLKHFAGHCDPQGGINLGPADVGMRKLREEYLPPFKAAVMEAGALSVMPAYSEIDGVPCSSSKFLLRQILREEWGFTGFTFADFGAVGMLADFHKTAGNDQQAGKQAFEAGLDMEAPEVRCYGNNLLELIRKGEVSMDRLDEAVGNILRIKFLTGLFENPYVDEGLVKDIVHCDKHVKLARKVAGESIVLLKNQDKLLPLDKSKISSIAVIGPNADVAECGDYCFPKQEDISPLQGIQTAVSSGTKVTFAPGCDMHDLNRDGFDEALQAARDSDVAVLCVGGSSMSLGGVGWVVDGKPTRPSTCGEGFDRTDLNLPGVQQELVEAVAATGTPVVVVLINGRPLSIPWIAEQVPAILEAWYPGEQGGHAIADILFGKVNPSAKLTMSIPRSVGQVPNYYCQKPSARGYYKKPGSPGKPGRDYVYSETSPLYEFGYGLSYTSFSYDNLCVSPSITIPEGKVKVSIDVGNTGDRPGKEVVQLYINDVVSSVTTPEKLLKRFEKVGLNPGEVKTITFELGFDDLSLLNEDMEPVVEPGVFEVMIGGLKKSFEVKKC
ncbi:MAG: glycoside hydrolase family 3 C-terminal domain-containing protein, partial [Spirochaetales bacterium]|nr:glycoside hydrolase family 3 C-terminal domain-containing protein [Spirochaetales bacterium]